MYRRENSNEKKILLILAVVLLFSPIFGYCQPLESQVNISVSAQVGEEVPPPPPPPPGGGGGAPAKTATVIFEGKAYPKALVTILRNGSVAGTVIADSSGDFSKTLTGVPAKTWTFGVYAKDTEGRKSVTLGFSISVIAETEMKVSGIFISPTIALSEEVVRRGATLEIFGQAYPKSDVHIFISSPTPTIKKIKTSQKGKWRVPLDTTPLIVGTHTSKAKAMTDEGEQSPFSDELIFKVVEYCKGADLNFDSRVDLVDFSILLYYWGQRKPANICADINQDGMVDLIDFSIMMYFWTG